MWKPVIQNVKGYAKGGKIPESFNQMPDEPGLVSNAGPLRESPLQDFQSRVESFNAEQDWRQGHQLTNMQKERVAEERGGLLAEGKVLQQAPAVTDLSTPTSSYDPLVQAPEPLPEDAPYQMGFSQRQRRPSGLGVSSLLGMQRGGTIDYRQGGAVAGGPPGVDTVPVVAQAGGPVKAMLNNGEYALPTDTVAAVGKPALDQLVVATTGQAPVGYGCGGKMKYGLGGLIDKLRGRDKQIDEAVNKVVQAPPPPPPEEPKGQSMADIMKEIRKKNPPVQGYAQGGMTELERKRMQAIDPRYTVAVGERPDIVRGAPAVMLDPQAAVAREVPVPMRFAPTMAGGNLVAAPATPGAAVVATAADRVPDFVERPRPPMPRGGVQPYGQSMPETRSAPTTYAAMPKAPLASTMPTAVAQTPAPIVPQTGLRIVDVPNPPFFRDPVRILLDRKVAAIPAVAAAREAARQPTAPIVANVVTQDSQMQRELRDRGLAKDVPVAAAPALPLGAPTAGQIRKSPLGLTPDAFNPTGSGYVGEVGGAPQGVSDADYAKMSLPEKSAARVKSIDEATAAIRSARNARREAEGSPLVGERRRGAIDLAGLDLRDRLAIANYQRGLGNDYREATQNDIRNQLSLADLKLKGAGEQRQQTKAQQEVQDRFIEQSAPFVQNFATDFPGMADSAVPFFNRASQLGLRDPAKVYSTLAGTYEILKGSKDTTPLFTVAGQNVTPAQAIAILNGEKPFDNWLRLKWAGKDLYDEARRVAAQKVQELALQGLAK